MKIRVLQIEEIIRQEMALIINQEVNLPTGCLITISRVKLTADLQNATVFISVIPEQVREKVLLILKKRRKPLQFLLHQKLTIHHSPIIKFALDKIVDQAWETEKLLKKIQEEEK